MSRSGPTVVVGAGLSGLAATDELLSAGRQVVLLEQRRLPGGRAGGFRDPVSGWLLENGQHVWMPCCTALTGLLRRSGADAMTVTQPRLEVRYLERDREPALLRAAPLPAPFHLLLPLLRFPLLGGRDRRALLRALVAMKLAGAELVETGSDRLLIDWLVEKGQTGRTLEVFWRPAITSILNVDLERARLDLGAMAVRTTFLAGRHDADIARSRVPHTRLWERVVEHLRDAGAEVLFGRRVVALEGAGAGVEAVLLAGGERIAVRDVVLAVPPPAAGRLLSTLTGSAETAPGAGLDWAPILNLHVWLDREVVEDDVVCLVESPLQWVFLKPSQDPEGGERPVPRTAQHLNLVVSASDRFLTRPPGETVEVLLSELAAHLPAVASAEVLGTRVVHERRATFRPVPGSESDRPGPAGPVPGTALAGAWTATGWPSTLEGAVRSGRAAARHLTVNPS